MFSFGNGVNTGSQFRQKPNIANGIRHCIDEYTNWGVNDLQLGTTPEQSGYAQGQLGNAYIIPNGGSSTFSLLGQISNAFSATRIQYFVLSFNTDLLPLQVQHDNILSMVNANKGSISNPFLWINCYKYSTRDSRTWHRRCDNRGALLVIAKLETGNIIGALVVDGTMGNNQNRTSGGTKLFVLDISNTALVFLPQNGAVQIRDDLSLGPSFGTTDLIIPLNLNTNATSVLSSYQGATSELVAGMNSFRIVDYEVYSNTNLTTAICNANNGDDIAACKGHGMLLSWIINHA